MIEEWMPTSNLVDAGELHNYWYVQGFDGFRKKGVDGNRCDQFRVVWEPSVFAADALYPDELPEVNGLPWARSDYDWQPARDFSSYKNDPFLGPQMVLLREGGGVVGGGGVVEGLE
jgi:hypothetical protein